MSLTKQGIRAVVKPTAGATDIDVAHRAVQDMIAVGADLISDFHEVKPTPKEIHEHGKSVRAFHALAYRKEAA